MVIIRPKSRYNLVVAFPLSQVQYQLYIFSRESSVDKVMRPFFQVRCGPIRTTSKNLVRLVESVNAVCSLRNVYVLNVPLLNKEYSKNDIILSGRLFRSVLPRDYVLFECIFTTIIVHRWLGRSISSQEKDQWKSRQLSSTKG